MEKKGWKITSIVLLILLLASVSFTVYIFHVGKEYETKRAICAYDICGLNNGTSDAYFYSTVDDSCFCFVKGELQDIYGVEDFLNGIY